MDVGEWLGYLAAVLVAGSSSMKTMVPLRVLSICSNFAFISYALVEGLLPILMLHSILLPINSFRLVQMQKLVRRMQEAAQGDLALEGLLPFMTRRKVARGEILFRKDEVAREMFYLLAGEIRLQELGRTIGSGAVLGEIGMFSPDRRRTATAICATDGELLAMTGDQVRRLYFQDPKFGFHLVQLITRRLVENCATPRGAPRPLAGRGAACARRRRPDRRWSANTAARRWRNDHDDSDDDFAYGPGRGCSPWPLLRRSGRATPRRTPAMPRSAPISSRAKPSTSATSRSATMTPR